MFDYINCEWLAPEIMDVIRLFGAEEEHFGYHFEYSAGKYYNFIEYGGKIYDGENFAETQDELQFRRYAKRFAKLAFYNLLSQAKNIKMPYGALTGIRPTKLAYSELAEGRDFEPLFSLMGVAEDNVTQVKNVIKTQKEIYVNAGGQNLFISLPFCPTKCEYCSFITAPITQTRALVEPYIGCLIKETGAVAPLITKIKSIYIGGGTPFAIECGQLAEVLKAVEKLNLEKVEYTVEAGRPDTFTEEKLALCRDFGVTRLCVNPQSFKDETLLKIGRKHTAAQTEEAFWQAKKFGFDVNVDLIAGLADETAEDFAASLDKAIALSPENITVHTLSLKAGAKLKGSCSRLRVDGIGEMIALSRKKLYAAGYSPYYMYRQKYQAGGWENCGWCKIGKASVYNVDVMEERADNVAVGANAISKRVFSGGERIERYASPKDIPTYISKTEKIIEERNKLFTK